MKRRQYATPKKPRQRQRSSYGKTRSHPPVTSPARRRVQVSVPVPAPVTVPDVCGLAERYGGWRPGSREARACREAARR
ncbi:hypothetical protein [Streptomyces sp. TRM64462]|uniref:hypothetical protein n=1 Tax=Streptomyces sp. TRM64462 TaxID=2741726 RepID=UPI001586E0A4|nr:hypothetical protein [Streptomyces sp. TRM64462]